VRVDPGAVVRDSIVMFDTVIRAGAVVDRAIIDKEVSIGPNAVVGMGDDMDTANRQEPGRLNAGITVIGKRSVIPAGVRLGRNVKVNEGVRPSDYGGKRSVASGGTIEAKAAAGRSSRTAQRGSTAKSNDGEPIPARISASASGSRR
jgi:glucose-1-phosphate adenylyltransferase